VQTFENFLSRFAVLAFLSLKFNFRFLVIKRLPRGSPKFGTLLALVDTTLREKFIFLRPAVL